jgi:hypothetical protein
MSDRQVEGPETFSLDLALVLLGSFVHQCSVNFRCAPQQISDWDHRPFVIHVSYGITYIESDDAPTKSAPEEFNTALHVPGDSNIPPDLERLTAELRKYTESLCDIKLADFQLTWGIKDGQLPCLLDCQGSTYSCTTDSEPYSAFILELCLFVAIETSQIGKRGHCFSQRPLCCGCDMNILREKIEIHRIRKLAVALQVPDCNQLIFYLHRQISKACPSLMLSSVPVCRNCFALYTKEKLPLRGATQTKSTQSTNVIYSARSHQSLPAAKLSLTQSACQTIVSKFNPAGATKSPSGLTYVQLFSLRSLKQSHAAYRRPPFPPFMKRP